jgi:hypothetical protein
VAVIWRLDALCRANWESGSEEMPDCKTYLMEKVVMLIR